MAELSNVPTELAFENGACVVGQLPTAEQIIADLQRMLEKMAFDGFKKAAGGERSASSSLITN